MPRIILHIGPEKCGSTSIQHTIQQGGHDYHAHLLDPYTIIGLDNAEADWNLLSLIGEQIATWSAEHSEKTLILSHEMIFKSMPMLKALSQLSRQQSDEVLAIAYVRRQSDFLVSGFGQWHFRTPERIAAGRASLEGHGIDPDVFWGVERHLIAGLLDGWHLARQPSGHLYMDWGNSIAERQTLLADQGISLSVGLLPRAGFEGSLGADFMHRAGLVQSNQENDVKNRSYHPALIEATVNAIETGHTMPGPHDANNFFASSSALGLGSHPPLGFLTYLKSCVDTQFAASNQSFADSHDHSPAYFEPDMMVDPDEALTEIKAEESRRLSIGRDRHKQDQATRAALAQVAWTWHQKAERAGKKHG